MTPREELEALRRLAELEAKERGGAPAAKPAVVQAGEGIMGIPRQLGLTARYGIEGLANMAELGTEPIRAVMQAAGAPKMSPLSQATANLLTSLGLPSPQNATERVVGDMSRMMAGSVGGSALSLRGAQATQGVASEVLSKLAAQPAMAMTAAAGAGGAGGFVREAGGSPMAQFGASVLGGVSAPLAVQGIRSASTGAVNALKGAMADPVQLDVRLSQELGRAGIKWENLGADIKRQIREDAKKALVSGQPLDPAALRRLADYRNIGATPLLGDITQDPAILTQQRNLAKQMANTQGPFTNNLPNIDNANARRVLQTLEGATSSADDAFASGQRIIGMVDSKDAAKRAAESGAYKAAEEAFGRDLPLDRGAFLNEAFDNLYKSNKTAFLPEPISNLLNQLGQGVVRREGKEYPVPFDVNTIDSLKTTLATASRSASDGNVRAAIKAVRDALENVQPKAQDFNGAQLVTGAQAAALRAGDPAAKAMGLFDTARGMARERRQWQESASFIEDALGGAAPDKFVQKHIIGGTVDDLTKLRAEIGSPAVSSSRALVPSDGPAKAGQGAQESAALLESVRKQLVSYILERGRADSDTVKFSSAGMNDALKAIGDRKLSLFFSPQEIQQLKSAVNVGRYMQSQPIGSAVNNSNTAGAALGRIANLLDRASPIPFVGPIVAQPLQGGLLRMQASRMNNLSGGLLSPQAQQALSPEAFMLPGLLAAGAVQQN